MRIGALATSLFGVLLSGCGTYVPDIQEIPFDEVGGQQFVQAIVTNVTCEVQNAFYDLNQDYHDHGGTFLDSWGVQITLGLTTEEKGTASPSETWALVSPATRLAGLNAGLSASGDATRIDKVNSYYLVQDLSSSRCPAANRPGGPFLMQSDLKLKQWLYDVVTASKTNTVQFGPDTKDGPFKENVLSHEVKFEVVTSGTVTPTLKLRRVSWDSSGTLFAASRDRTHDLIITIGPADTTMKPKMINGKKVYVVTSAQPSQQAMFLHLSSTIGAAVADGIRHAEIP